MCFLDILLILKALANKDTMCDSRKYPYLPHGRDFFLRPPTPLEIPIILHTRLQNSRFWKAGSAISVILKCEAREPHMPAGRVRRENDSRLFIQQIRSKEGLYNVTEVTEIA